MVKTSTLGTSWIRIPVNPAAPTAQQTQRLSRGHRLSCWCRLWWSAAAITAGAATLFPVVAAGQSGVAQAYSAGCDIRLGTLTGWTADVRSGTSSRRDQTRSPRDQWRSLHSEELQPELSQFIVSSTASPVKQVPEFAVWDDFARSSRVGDSQARSAAPGVDAPTEYGIVAQSCMTGFLWPVSEPEIVRPFEAPESPWAPGHRGVDLATRTGSVLLAPADGTVSFAGQVAGKSVVSIQHDGLVSSFEPAQTDLPKGTAVRRGETFGFVRGRSDHCGTTCVHWGVRRGVNDYLDPAGLVAGGRIVLKSPNSTGLTGRPVPE